MSENDTQPTTPDPRDAEIAALKAQLDEAQAATASSREREAAAVARYLDSVVSAFDKPSLKELVTGDTVEDIDAAAARARAIAADFTPATTSTNGNGNRPAPGIPAPRTTAAPTQAPADKSPYSMIRDGLAARASGG